MYMYTYLYIQSRLRTVSIYRLHFCWIFSVSWESPSPILPSIYSECSSSSSNVQRNTSTFKHGFSIIEKIEIVNQNFLFPFLNPSKMYQYIFSLPPFIDYLGTGITSPPPPNLCTSHLDFYNLQTFLETLSIGDPLFSLFFNLSFSTGRSLKSHKQNNFLLY